MTWRSLWICLCLAMWLAARLAYCKSFWRASNSKWNLAPARWAPTKAAVPRHVVEYRLDRRVGENAAVPIKITVDPYRREGRWKRAGCHHMTIVNGHSRLSK